MSEPNARVGVPEVGVLQPAAHRVPEHLLGVGAWVDAHVGELAADAPIAVHLDRVQDLSAAGDLVGAALGAFAALVAHVAALGDPGRAGLVIPLRAAGAGPADAPATPAALARELHPNEPPSLCLVAWPGGAATQASEERRAPLPFALGPADGSLPAGRVLRAYYLEHRPPSAVGGQPLERAVCLDAYPPGRA